MFTDSYNIEGCNSELVLAVGIQTQEADVDLGLRTLSLHDCIPLISVC